MKKTIFNLFMALSVTTALAQPGRRAFTDTFYPDSCTFQSTGRNMYFILEPGFQLTLQGIEDGDTVRVVITVLHETKRVGNTETRVVEEHESVNGQVIEISRNYFAICKETGSVFYFGEDVDIYKNGRIVKHSGHGQPAARIKPGS